ncbi:hypothetical protein SLA2020_091330 [Shorea laevis]
MAKMHDLCPMPQTSNCPSHFSIKESPQLPEPIFPLHSLQPPLHSIPNPESPQPSEPSPLHSESLQPSPPSPLHSESLQQSPPSPLYAEVLQPSPPSSPNQESRQPIPQQPPLIMVDPESQQFISNAAQQNLQWQNAILSFCFTSALEISLQFAKTQSKLPLSFSLVAFAVLITFAFLLLAKFISREHTKVSRVLEKVAFLIAAATFCYTTTIPFPVGFKFVIWSIFSISLLILVICKYFCHTAA